MIEMEMPTPCQRCDEIFDLHDGRSSPREANRPGYQSRTVICESCADKEEQEIEREQEIEDLRGEIEEAEYTLRTAKERLRELIDAPPPSD